MDRRRLLRWSAIALGASTALLAAAALGFWCGLGLDDRVRAGMAHQVVIGEVERMRVALSRLDAGRHEQLREELNRDLDGKLLTLCLGSPLEVVDAQARGVIRRVAAQRRDHPPSYPAGWPDQDAAALEVHRRVADCLAGALEDVERSPERRAPGPEGARGAASRRRTVGKEKPRQVDETWRGDVTPTGIEPMSST